jgi:hypothetical protein
MKILRKMVRVGIGVAAAIAVVIAVILQHYSLVSLEKVQFSHNSVGSFDSEALALDVFIDVCNPTQFPTGFDKM